MKIVWIKPGGLWPLNTGGRLRSFHILSELGRRNEVTLLTTHGPSDDPEGLKAKLGHCRVVSLPYVAPKHGSAAFLAALVRSWASPMPVDVLKHRQPAVIAEAQALLRGADLCIADFLTSVSLAPLQGPVPVVVFSHNVEHVIWKRLYEAERSPWRKAALAIEWRKMRRYEAWACREARLTLAVSDADRDMLLRCAPGSRIESIPTGVNTEYFRPASTPEKPGRMVFTGSMDWYPNEDATSWFVEQILPRLRQQVPEASFTVVGRKPSARVQALAGPNVTITGTVDDVRPYIADASVYVVPLRIGGGTRLKIFEALAMGKAVVSTTIGAEGLPVENGRNVVLADDADSFAAEVAGVLRDRPRARALGAAGRDLVESRYSWPQVAREFEQRCMEVFSNESERVRSGLRGIRDGGLPRASGA